jgi:hypothetical protein
LVPLLPLKNRNAISRFSEKLKIFCDDKVQYFHGGQMRLNNAKPSKMGRVGQTISDD